MRSFPTLGFPELGRNVVGDGIQPASIRPSFGAPYSQRIIDLFGSSLIGYWILNEPSGTAIIDYSPQAQTNGLYSGGVSLANDESPPGTLAPLFNGTNGRANVFSAGWAADFNGQLGSYSIWFKLNNHVNFDYMLYVAVDASNIVGMQSFSSSNTFQCVYVAGGTTKNKNFAAAAGWHNVVMTWTKAGDALAHYLDGVVQGVTLTGLGTYTGTIVNTDIASAGNALFWNGHIAHVAFLNRVMTPAEVLQQYQWGIE